MVSINQLEKPQCYDSTDDVACYSPEQMQSICTQARLDALEEAACVIEADIYPAPLTAYQKQYNAGVALRALKIRSLT